jgi:hypothetical protein
LVEAGLALLDGTYTGPRKNGKKKALVKAKEALAKAQETKSEAMEAEEATKVTIDTMKAGFQVVILRRPNKPRRPPRVQ